ncbi:hypothetical protein PI124_g17237 [Phytophthora idaei]|nr:hypothetical protein PI125_g23968 [Phytophthora idaei]KAG3125669.1 hypothetical protein PI126_g22660 [Phytophthora idaei]KAG3237787.1 hypothetical protein PI124_g17237 [Phytophthora idaei]
MYKDRHGLEFENTVREWAVAAYPDLTDAGHRDDDLPVGEREHVATQHHDLTDYESSPDDDKDTVRIQRRDGVHQPPAQQVTGMTTMWKMVDAEDEQEANVSDTDVSSDAGGETSGVQANEDDNNLTAAQVELNMVDQTQKTQ